MIVSATSLTLRRSVQFAVIGLTLAVSAGVVAFVTIQLRTGLRRQSLQSRAESLSAVASLQLTVGAEALQAATGLSEVPGDLLEAALKTSKFPGVLAIRVFDAKQRFAGAVPLELSDDAPAADDWSERAHARLSPRKKLRLLAGDTDTRGSDGENLLLEAWVPLRRADGGRLAGVAQFWIDGADVAAEFAAMDRGLALQASMAWLAGAIVIVSGLGWAFRRLAAAHRALELRTEDLQRANRELVLAAKTSALGAVTAHLIHEIKHPLAGLEVFMAGQAESGARDDDGRELLAATELTKRLRTMINDVVEVLRDEQQGAHFELTSAEVAELAIQRVRPAASSAGVRLVLEMTGGPALEGRRANLAGLVLRNLLQNAVEASPPAGIVRITGGARGDRMEFLVEDRGPGLAAAVRARLFQPCPSTKPGGSGLGLALSQQIAQQAGGRIELVRSGADGTCFRLVLEPVA